MSEPVQLAKKRPPTRYILEIAHHWDGTIEVFVRDIPDTPRSHAAVAYALARASEMFPEEEIKWVPNEASNNPDEGVEF